MGRNESRQSPDHECLDEVFEALCHGRRRRFLSKLRESSPVDVEEYIRDAEEAWGCDGSEGAARDAEQLRVTLHHRHLPKLEDAGLVEWDGGERVRRGPKFDGVADLIELLEAHDDRLPGRWP